MTPEKRKEYKQRYFDKKKAEAEFVSCKCGCGEQILNRDSYGRINEYVSGHNSRRHNDGKTAKQRYYEQNTDAEKKRAQDAKTPTARRLKIRFIHEKGGCCKNCGLEYNGTNGVVFQFHHLRDKLFNLTANAMYSYSLSKIEAEVAKCDLLCGNCHALHHHGGW